MVKYDDKLAREYCRLFFTAQVTPSHKEEVTKSAFVAILNKSRYEDVISRGSFKDMPWFFIAAIHCLEGSYKFNTHLHNGDPLTGRTFRVPAGRPKTGNPPFTWEESAIDALRLKKLGEVSSWKIPELLWRLECYNGLGYRMYHSEVLSPYLWSFTQHYTKGKYVSDGKTGWDSNAVSKQVGAVALIRTILEIT